MPYSPVELRHVRLGRSLFGYKRGPTERLLDEVAASFEDVWSERGELADQVEDLSKALAEIREREHLLASTLVAAEKAAAESRSAAKREAEVIVAEAHQEARSITRAAQAERERLFAEARRIEALLRAALGLVEESNKPPAVGAWPDPATDEEPAGAEALAEPAVEPVDELPEGFPEPLFEDDPELPQHDAEPAEAEAPAPWVQHEDTAEFPSLINTRIEAEHD